MALHMRRVPSTGETLPAIGLGTWKSFDVDEGLPRAGAGAVLTEFAAGGGRLVDTSPMYGKAEAAIGDLAANAGLLDQLFIATKVWTTGREDGVRQMRDSMAKLRVD